MLAAAIGWALYSIYLFYWKTKLGIFQRFTLIAFSLYTMVQKELGASLTGFTLYIFTIYGAIYGYFLFGEKLENYHFIGTVLVFLGIYLAKKKNVKKN